MSLQGVLWILPKLIPCAYYSKRIAFPLIWFSKLWQSLRLLYWSYSRNGDGLKHFQLFTAFESWNLFLNRNVFLKIQERFYWFLQASKILIYSLVHSIAKYLSFFHCVKTIRLERFKVLFEKERSHLVFHGKLCASND